MISYRIIQHLKGRISLFYLFFLLLTLLVSNNSFFWDTVQLASRHANFYFGQNLKLLLLPDNMDSGHIPAFGYLLAVSWKLFGKNLFVSHLFMLPFLLGTVYHAFKLISWFFDKNKYWVLILFLADPSLLAQAVLVSPDIPLIFFMVMLLNGILYDKPSLKIIAVTGLALVSMRGWMVATMLFIFDGFNILYLSHKKLKNVLKQLAYYLPGGFIALLFILIHYQSKGWVGYHENSPWAGSFAKTGFMGFIYNIFIFGWRLIDFGRVIWWIILIFFVPFILKRLKSDKKLQSLVFLTFIFLLIFPVNMLIHKYLTQHRYFLPVYLIIALTISYILYLKININRIAPFILVALLAGNLIVYPDKIAQGWDATLAHLPYYKMRKNVIQFMNGNRIGISNTKCWFPNLSPANIIDLSNDTTRFTDKKLSSCPYCLYSNIYNDIDDNEYDEVMTWDLVYKQEKAGIKMLLFKNPDK